jgi:Prenyltransferase and squalene oxidase repeat
MAIPAMNGQLSSNATSWYLAVFAIFIGQAALHAQEDHLFQITPPNVASQLVFARSTDKTPDNTLSAEEWRRVDLKVNRGLAFLALQQQPDGSFPSLPYAQPAVTSLCVLAFMAHGHAPGNGPYGKQLERAVRFIINCQKPSGLIVLVGGDEQQINRKVPHDVGVAGTYDHAISSLTLAELFGMNPSSKIANLKNVINKSVRVTLEIQNWSKKRPEDKGGMRYIVEYGQSDSDLSVTGWHLMFLRSARNAGFDVPEKSIADAVTYIRRTFREQYGTFNYTTTRGDVRSRGMAGAGILALGHAGFHNSAEAKQAAESLLSYRFDVYNDNNPFPKRDRYHYSLFMCCQGMYQMGSPYWEQFFPRTIRTVLAHQQPDGSWDAESFQRDRRFGNSYTTALVILAVGAPNQLLPIFQR